MHRSPLRETWLLRASLPATLGLVVMIAVAGCGRNIEYRPFDYDYFYGRQVLILDATSLPPLSEDVADRVESRIEAYLSQTPHLGRVITRKAARESLTGDRATLSRYDLLSDVASVLSLAERELTLAMAKSQSVDFVATFQALHLPCPHCDKSDRVAVMAQFFEVQNARLVWRNSISRDIANDADPESVSAAIAGITDDLLENLEHLLKPKWQRLRFNQLKGVPPAWEGEHSPGG